MRARMPDDSNSSDERRRHPRAALSLLVQYRFNTFEDFLAEYSADISAGGLFIRTTEPREEGTFLYLQFWREDGTRLIEGTGKVARVISENDRSGMPPGMGIEFVNLDPQSIDLIHQIVAARVTPKRG
jgi:molecular chaperone DnaK